jgi:DNA-directed RNA polymerase subunit M/transcription elongation factor TFIIS
MEDQNVRCLRCESDNFRTFTKQIRASDDGPNKYYKCLDCQYGWKHSPENTNAQQLYF